MGSQGGAVEEGKLQSLCRQGSLYSLTLDEVQNQLGDLGKPLGSMNLDELLKSVSTAQDNVGVGACPSSLPHHQGSLALSRDLSKKTVDEVWKDIQQKKRNDASDVRERKTQHGEPTFGEMTLEDFLVEAGVNTELPRGNNGAEEPHQPTQWIPIQLPSVQRLFPEHQHNVMTVFISGQQHPIQQSVPVLDAAYSDTQNTMSPTSLMGALSDTQTPGRKRVASGDVVEKTVERRQKRMIKNRESAARSRARKQAYTHELEIKVSRLEEENQRLRREKEAEQALPCAPPPEPRHQLRRTTSAPF
ncbi:hypothetical protein K2173_009855 [Erythroxylum novogranatense]|uniref:BZIP domain-containing protein n=1 Tax=Erythroxylum novogranatense TaxID=1862640 RepID=A0AAV8T044_9ROSI|nr:hypothetical protein K2173_009855 [Erythroxylum novogranatense]